MPFYKQLSGAQKRRKKSQQDLQLKTFKGSMEKFIKINSDKECPADLPVLQDEMMDVSQPISSECELNPDNCSLPNDNLLEKVPEITYTSYNLDVGLWPREINDEFREFFIHNKPNQNIDKISASKCLIGNKNRLLKESNFYRKKKNNELVNREWLMYSPSQNAVFCYVCKLFSTSEQTLCKNGFSDWKNIAARLREHENSETHRNSVLSLSQRLLTSSRIDSKLIEEYEAECLYWKKVLMRVVACVKYLSQRGLAFFGCDETLQSSHNGNFLGCIELLSNFDPFLSEHLSKYGNPGKGNVNYLSSTIVTEVIDIMGEKVLDVIVTEVKKAKYFGLILDSTPDITHNDQLAVVLRYVSEAGTPIERFVKFIHIHSHESSQLVNNVISLLEELGLDLKNCRGQSYDNANNMSGKYSGLQSRIKHLSPLATYVPCAAHSLNLVGHNAAECCEYAVSFFGLVQTLYVFFSCSTHRWEILSSKLAGGLTLKPVSTTRWSAAADATKCLRQNYKCIREALEVISEDCAEKAATRHEAKTLSKKLEKFETAVLSVVWDTILQRLNSVNKTLQTTTGNISILIPLYGSLINFIQLVRNDFEKYEQEACKLVESTYEIKRKRKVPIARLLDDSGNEGVSLIGRDLFKTQCHYVICDSLLSELKKRKEAYLEVDNRFSFLMKNDCAETLKEDAKSFQILYSSDIDEEFVDEAYQFFHFLSGDISSPEEKLKTIRTQNIVHTFPNIDIALQILLTMPISNCTSERSFSALKRIKNRLRSTVKQENLTSLSLLSIESNLTSTLDFEEVISIFASKKARKKPF